MVIGDLVNIIRQVDYLIKAIQHIGCHVTVIWHVGLNLCWHKSFIFAIRPPPIQSCTSDIPLHRIVCLSIKEGSSCQLIYWVIIPIIWLLIIGSKFSLTRLRDLGFLFQRIVLFTIVMHSAYPEANFGRENTLYEERSSCLEQ